MTTAAVGEAGRRRAVLAAWSGGVLIAAVAMASWRPALLLPVGVFAALTVLALSSFENLRRLFFWVLVAKPVIDCFWDVHFGGVVGQNVNLQSALALVPIAALVAAPLRFRSEWKGVRSTLPWLLLALPIVSVAFSFPQGVKEMLKLWSGLSVFLLAAALLSEDDVSRLVKAIYPILIFLLVYSLAQKVGLVPFTYFEASDVPIGRISGPYDHPLNLVSYLLVAHPFLVLQSHRAETRPAWRRMARIVLPVFYFVLFFTYHRTALILVGVQLALLVAWRPRLFSVALLFVAVTGACAVSSKVTEEFVSSTAGNFHPFRSAPFGRETQTPGLLGPSSLMKTPALPAAPAEVGGHGVAGPFRRSFLRGRGDLWFLFLENFRSHGPLHWLLGDGWAAVWRPDTQEMFDEPHGDYVRLLISYGAIWLLLYLAFLLKLSLDAFSLSRTNGDASELGLIAVVLLVTFAIFSVPMESMRFPSTSWYVMAVVAVAARIAERRKTVAER